MLGTLNRYVEIRNVSEVTKPVKEEDAIKHLR